jgi:hypothetical protein
MKIHHIFSQQLLLHQETHLPQHLDLNSDGESIRTVFLNHYTLSDPGKITGVTQLMNLYSPFVEKYF